MYFFNFFQQIFNLGYITNILKAICFNSRPGVSFKWEGPSVSCLSSSPYLGGDVKPLTLSPNLF